jgi:hypothetical protein
LADTTDAEAENKAARDRIGLAAWASFGVDPAAALTQLSDPHSHVGLSPSRWPQLMTRVPVAPSSVHAKRECVSRTGRHR